MRVLLYQKIRHPLLVKQLIFLFFKASTCRAISVIACLRLLNQCHLILYHYTSRQHLQPDHGLSFYMRVEADDRAIHLRKQRQAQYAESSDHFELASACVTFVQDVAWSLLSEPYIAIQDRRCVIVPLALLLLFKSDNKYI